MPGSVCVLKLRALQRMAAAAVAAGGAALLTGCVVAPMDGVDYGYSSTTVYTSYGHPPPIRQEYRPRPPSASHVWIDGLWMWSGQRYEWRSGYWDAPAPRPSYYTPAPRPHMAPPVHYPAPPPVQARPQPQPRPQPYPQLNRGNDRPAAQPQLQRPAPQGNARPQGGDRPPQPRAEAPARPPEAPSRADDRRTPSPHALEDELNRRREEANRRR